MTPALSSALTRYRVLAYVVGVVLLVLTCVAMPVRYVGGEPRLSEAVSPVHGFLYLVYVGVAFDLARRMRWSLGRTLALLLAGTVPFLSFWFERRTTARVRAGAGG